MAKTSKSASKLSKKSARRPAKKAETPAKPEPRPEPVEPVVKAKRNAGLSASELKHFRELLLAKRATLVGDVTSMANEALGKNRQDASGDLSNMPIHMADIGSDNYEQEFTLGLLESEHALLREISAALARMEKGAYGICMGTGKPIGKPRLEAKPWAKYSIEYARQVEKGLAADIEVEDPAGGRP
ncbi:MAG: TraR/DksA C4-type zinc finger protein [Phycisphaerae bacterium]|nr:TraR/DksA C4-type zinc finger protein [Phycisphaerae bacterium]